MNLYFSVSVLLLVHSYSILLRLLFHPVKLFTNERRRNGKNGILNSLRCRSLLRYLQHHGTPMRIEIKGKWIKDWEGNRIHRQHLCRGIRPPPTCVLDMTLKTWCWGSSNTGALGSVEYPFISIDPRSTLARSCSTWYSTINGSNKIVSHLNCQLRLN